MKNKYIKLILMALLTLVVVVVLILPDLQNRLPKYNTNNSGIQEDQTAPDTIQVSLSINQSPSNDLEIVNGSNHCDLLNQALEMQIVDSLKMEFNEQYQTYGVYKINDIGKDNEVWWVFTVNGESPPAGCDGVMVNEGDQVVWEYLGN